jgi:hypothetical protein
MQQKKFPGFPPKPSMNFWSYPKDLNGYWHQLNGSEQKCLDYILRHTWGFDKISDEISFTQLEKGINGFDKGTGLSRRTIIRSIQGLVKKGFIKKAQGTHANNYQLVTNLHHPSVKNTPPASVKSKHTIDNITIDNTNKGNLSFRGQKVVKNYGRYQVWTGGKWVDLDPKYWTEVK